MFTAYKIGITVALTNQVSSILGMIGRDFVKTDAQAVALKNTLKEIKLLGASGLLLGGLGYAGLRVIQDMVKPATEYAHQLNIMNMAGIKQQEIAEAVAAAWKNTGDVITTTATQNLKSMLDLRNILGNVDEARMALPIISRIEAVMQSSKEGAISSQAHDFAFSMAKALDIIGAASNPAQFENQAAMMAKVITAMQGRVTPAMFQGVFTYARQGKFDLSDEFKYEILPTLMLEMSAGAGGKGGGSRGVGPALAAMYRFTNQGYINKAAMPELQSLGLVNSSTAVKTTTQGTTVGAMAAHELAASDPFRWVNEILVPAIKKKYGNQISDEELRFHINQITRGNQLAASYFVEFATKQKNFLRDQAIIKGAMPPDQAYRAAMQNDPQFAYQALGAQWENLKPAFGISVVPIIVPAIMSLTRGLNAFAQWAQLHPALVDALTYSFTALSASLLFSGTVLGLAAAFKSIGLAINVLSAGTAGTISTQMIALAGGIGVIGVAVAAAAGALGFAIAVWQANQNSKDPAYVAQVWGNMHKPGPGSSPANSSGPRSLHAGTVPSDGSKSYADIMADAVKSALQGANIHMDGAKVGRLMFSQFARDADGPATSTSRFDPSMNYMQPDATR